MTDEPETGAGIDQDERPDEPELEPIEDDDA